MKTLKKVSLNKLDFEKGGGIIPVVVQEYGSEKGI
jgi:hypothetical protein